MDIRGVKCLYFQVEMLTRKLNMRIELKKRCVCIVEVIGMAFKATEMDGITWRMKINRE